MELIGQTFYWEWEVALMTWIQAHIGDFGTAIFSFFSLFGEQLVGVALLGFLYWVYDKEYGTFVGRNVLVALVWNPLLKNIFIRRRPYFDHPGIRCLKPVDKSADLFDIAKQGYSFPSGHSTQAVAAFTSLPAYRKDKKWLWVVGLVIPLLVGISRFCLGVHYPTDVLCGWALGAVAITVVMVLQRAIRKEWARSLILILTAVPGFFYCKSEEYYTCVGMLIGFGLAVPFEKKFVRFENTRSIPRAVLRVLGGGALYFGLNVLLKLPFDSAFLDSGTTAAFLVRTARYAVILFTLAALYPLVFRLFRKKEQG
ncbi:MAG: phosphatase PAP2 family protein [Ruminococcus sp.]|nr:phosphatase PAP2 family protein [Candidatus Apopatosoma intestinale]